MPVPAHPDGPGSRGPEGAADRLRARAWLTGLTLAIGAVALFPAWALFDRALEAPDLAAAFVRVRLLVTVPMAGLIAVLWATPLGRRHPAPFAVGVLATVQLSVGWMLPQVQSLELYLLAASLTLFACGAVLAATPWWSLLLTLATAAGVGLGLGVTASAPDPGMLLPTGCFLGTASVIATIGHLLRWRSMTAEARWRCALEAEQETTHQLVAELRRLTVEDPLTGLANRRRWDEAIAAACADARAGGDPVAVVHLDVDHFKTVNDRLGHVGGDGVLRGIGALLQTAVRREDVAARLGGDEFAVLLPGTDAAAATALAERIRDRASTLSLPGTVVSVSAGVAVARGADAHPERRLAAADGNLYVAKRRRDAVVGPEQGPRPARRSGGG